MVDSGGDCGGIIRGCGCCSSSSFIVTFWVLIHTPSIFSRKVLFSLLELGISLQSWCWRGLGSSSWGVDGGSLAQPMVFIISTDLKLFSTSGAL